MATQITIPVDDQLRFVLAMAKSCYLHQQVLGCDTDDHSYRVANYDLLQELYERVAAALRAPADPSIA